MAQAGGFDWLLQPNLKVLPGTDETLGRGVTDYDA